MLRLYGCSQVTEVAREDPLQLSRNTVQEQTAVIAFTARYYSGLPFQVLLCTQASCVSPRTGAIAYRPTLACRSESCSHALAQMKSILVQEPVTVLLKEYLPGARSVACNEMQALVHLAGGLPDRKWHTAIAPITGELPIVPLLGDLLSSSPTFCRAKTTKHAMRQSSSECPEHSTLCMFNRCSIMRHWLYLMCTRSIALSLTLLMWCHVESDSKLRASCRVLHGGSE